MSETAESFEDEGIEQEQEYQGPTDEQVSAAKNQGWAPKDRWKGDPNDWVDADEFLERGARHNNILRERNEQLLSELQSTREELRSSVREFGKATRAAEERAHQRAMTELNQREQTAFENGDTQEWSNVRAEREQLEKERIKAEQIQSTQESSKPDPDNDPAYTTWLAENNWYNQDVEATFYANEAAKIIGNRYPRGQLPPRAFYDEITQEVKRKYPDKFRNVARDAPNQVQGGSQGGGRRKRGKSYNDLPPEAKAYCDKFVSQKLMSRDQYVTDYFGE